MQTPFICSPIQLMFMSTSNALDTTLIMGTKREPHHSSSDPLSPLQAFAHNTVKWEISYMQGTHGVSSHETY